MGRILTTQPVPIEGTLYPDYNRPMHIAADGSISYVRRKKPIWKGTITYSGYSRKMKQGAVKMPAPGDSFDVRLTPYQKTNSNTGVTCSAADNGVLTVSSTANFTVGDYIKVGADGDLCRIEEIGTKLTVVPDTINQTGTIYKVAIVKGTPIESIEDSYRGMKSDDMTIEFMVI